jgi:hypothetical protein
MIYLRRQRPRLWPFGVRGGTMDQEAAARRARLTTPRAAAVAGILFSALLLASTVLIRLSVPEDAHRTADWLADSGESVALALNLVPFAGIAFLWFIGVVRDRLGEHEDRFFATVFLGSGLLYLGTLFVAVAIAGSVISAYGSSTATLFDASTLAFGRVLAYEILNVYAMKMAGVFMISTCTLSLRTGIFPRWMALLGVGLALLLLLGIGYSLWAQLLFPLWVLLISVYILLANLRRSREED